MCTGLIWVEVKQLWDAGIYEYLHDMWNFLDFITNSLYVAVIILRCVAYIQVATHFLECYFHQQHIWGLLGTKRDCERERFGVP